jgi:hypothetical protein
LQFWRQQENAQADTEPSKHIPAIVDGYDRLLRKKAVQHLKIRERALISLSG